MQRGLFLSKRDNKWGYVGDNNVYLVFLVEYMQKTAKNWKMINLTAVRHQIITMNSSINTLSYSRKVNGQSINCVIQWSTEVFVDNNNNFGQGIDA